MSARLSINHAYFHEALSGEFFVAHNPEASRRSVGRLLMETYECGEIFNPNSHREERIFRPTWAPIDAALHICRWDIHCFTLASSERQMDFIHTFDGTGTRTLQVVDNANVVLDEPLGLERGPINVQFIVAQLAEDFFRTVALEGPRQ